MSDVGDFQLLRGFVLAARWWLLTDDGGTHVLGRARIRRPTADGEAVVAEVTHDAPSNSPLDAEVQRVLWVPHQQPRPRAGDLVGEALLAAGATKRDADATLTRVSIDGEEFAALVRMARRAPHAATPEGKRDRAAFLRCERLLGNLQADNRGAT